MTPVDSVIATTIRGLAAARSMTHKDVASEVGIAPATFDRRLSRGGWTVDEAVRLAQLFEVTLDQLTTALEGQLVPEA